MALLNGIQLSFSIIPILTRSTWPDNSFAVAALSHYNSWPFTSHQTAAMKVLYNLKSAAVI
jgi:hypothetical protein